MHPGPAARGRAEARPYMGRPSAVRATASRPYDDAHAPPQGVLPRKPALDEGFPYEDFLEGADGSGGGATDMTTATKERVRLDRVDNGQWLSRLLTDVQTEIALQPSAIAIERMRGRIQERMKESVRAAA